MKGNEPTKRDVFRQLKKRYVHGDICPYDDLYESEKDYDKAFHYYTKAMNNGLLKSRIKVADMYKNGYGVEQDMDKYVELIEE
ncbi:MAG: sel1 repeat family protein, partial [Erysipelotrichaceae bacterium]|nr:sel1 repeat family protein [Erysipelotrichaceae bacterium]